MFFITEYDAENHWIDKDMPTDISIVDYIVVYTISRNQKKKLNKTENKTQKNVKFSIYTKRRRKQIPAKRKVNK